MTAPVAALDLAFGTTRDIVECTPIPIGSRVIRYVAIELDDDGYFLVLTGIMLDGQLDLWIPWPARHKCIADARKEAAERIAEAQCDADLAAGAIDPKEVLPC